jgi:O-antigen/teichoic acid export membrane protein
MGYFSKASSTERMASTSISSIISQVAYPLYAAKQDSKEELINIIKRITMTISFLTTPLMVALC